MMPSEQASTCSRPGGAASPTAWVLFIAFLQLGATAFGGPAAVAQMRDLVVMRKRWLPERALQEGIALCQTVPGATAMQCAAYIGLRVRGLVGAAAAFAGFALPAFVIMLTASVTYSHALSSTSVQATLVGLRVAIVAIVASAAIDFCRTALRAIRHVAIVGSSATLLLLGLNPVLVILAAACGGLLLLRVPTPALSVFDPGASTRDATRRVAIVLTWDVVLTLALSALSPQLTRLALTMMRIDALAFGGGYASLPLMFDAFVQPRGSLTAGTFVDGIALGQVTPGPIVITATFLGYQVAGLLGALVATGGVFLPSFTIVVAIAPWFERLQSYPRFQSATRGAALSFAGLLVSVSVHLARSLNWSGWLAILAVAAVMALQTRAKVGWVILVTAAAAAYDLVREPR